MLDAWAALAAGRPSGPSRPAPLPAGPDEIVPHTNVCTVGPLRPRRRRRRPAGGGLRVRGRVHRPRGQPCGAGDRTAPWRSTTRAPAATPCGSPPTGPSSCAASWPPPSASPAGRCGSSWAASAAPSGARTPWWPRRRRWPWPASAGGRPVRVELSREEDLAASQMRMPAIIRLTTGRAARRHAAGPAGRAPVGRRGLRLQRRRHRPPRAQGGLRALPHPARRVRLAHGLHQQAAHRVVPGLRDHPGRLGLRVADGRHRPPAWGSTRWPCACGTPTGRATPGTTARSSTG